MKIRANDIDLIDADLADEDTASMRAISLALIFMLKSRLFNAIGAAYFAAQNCSEQTSFCCVCLGEINK